MTAPLIGFLPEREVRVRQREFRWFIAPGFTIIQVRNAFCEHGVMALDTYSDVISVRQRKGWKPVRISTNVRLEKP